MTYEQYWEMDCLLVKAYREAEKLRRDQKNMWLWLQGMYVYDAMCCASPLMQSFARKGTKAHPYPDKPYPIGGDKAETKRKARETKEKNTHEKGMMFMQNYMYNFNARFGKKNTGADK